MKKFIFLLAGFLFFLQIGEAQDLKWAKALGSIGDDRAFAMDIDAAGNIITCGYFQDTLDADPGPLAYYMYSNGSYDAYVCKLDSSGNFIWAISFGGPGWENAYSIETDANGNVYVTGDFAGNVDVDPGTGSYNISSNGFDDAYIIKLDPTGNLLWATSFGGNNYDYCTGIKIGKSGDLYVTGTVTDTIDMDPGPGSNLVTGSGCFISRFSNTGNLKWAKTFPAISIGKTLAVDSAENIILMGGFFGTQDFDPGAGVTNLTAVTGSGDICIQKIDSAGNFIWAKSIGADQGMGYEGIAIDGQQNILLTGNYINTGDFDPGTGIFTLTSQGGTHDIYVCKLTNAGNFIWAKSIGGASTDLAMSVTCDSLGAVYITGTFNGIADFDPNAGLFTLTAPMINSCYLAKLDANGNFTWAGTTGNGHGNEILVNENYDVITAGWFGVSGDFDLDTGTYIINPIGDRDIFIFKLGQDLCSNMVLIVDSITSLQCTDSAFIAIHAESGNYPYSYAWNTIPLSNDSTIFISNSGIFTSVVTDTIGCTRTFSILQTGPIGISQFDLDANLIAGNFIPGFSNSIWLDGFNDGCVSVSGTLSVVLDSSATYSSAIPLPDNISGDTLSWNFTNLNYDSAHVTPIINVTTSSSAQIGDTVCFEVFISPTAGDADTTNNHKTYCFPVLNGYDPNDISIYPQGICPEKYVLNNQKLTYTIRFQNTGNSNAVNINVLDSLDSDLDLSSVRVIANSHPLITEVLPGNVLKFRFDNIMLPDSASNEPASHGYVIYEVDPLPSLANGTQIKNQADIYFDFNPAVITNEVMNTIIDSIPACSITTGLTTIKNSSIKVYPNPAKDAITIEGIARESTVKIYDVSGRIVMEQKAVNEKTIINTSNLQNGIYLIGSNSKENQFFDKIIISR